MSVCNYVHMCACVCVCVRVRACVCRELYELQVERPDLEAQATFTPPQHPATAQQPQQQQGQRQPRAVSQPPPQEAPNAAGPPPNAEPVQPQEGRKEAAYLAGRGPPPLALTPGPGVPALRAPLVVSSSPGSLLARRELYEALVQVGWGAAVRAGGPHM